MKQDKWVRRFSIPSHSTSGKSYTVATDGKGGWGCTCWPWKRTREECDHIREAQAMLAKEIDPKQPKPSEAPYWLFNGQYADGTKEWRLMHLDARDGHWKNSPYFIHKEARPLDRQRPYVLLGSGMGEPCWLAGGKRSAGKFGWHRTLAEAKKAGLAMFDEDKTKGLL
jgi:hypothetical protein